ncbi:Phosphate ABC transporter, periplasmic phosphate-binding protein PstS [Rhodopirellula islandica]|uniref:Phosphate ABC transporter, periplasmic phosphate-binding protein PstS n=1 Tax=Rhodopirellula islandica TaxID=595434 RepID=A0A0J1B7K8_RHOIS|nr:substrate-binding domain-containing protein [Rhodopirellula islandica]KLU02825.1 Phosphate ABC transporter, periplasmic phosphate-binding protein PstS [Rhodopirellula islandica]
MTETFAIVGFLLAAYYIVANDAIQTLGTFLSSNAKRPWWLLWAFACTVLMIVFVYGWISNDGDVSFGRLSKFPQPAGGITWLHIIPPIIILFLTRFGVPVSTTFLVLAVFAPGNMTSMLTKSMLGYLVSFFVAIGVYVLIAKTFEKKIADSKDKPAAKPWYMLQWVSTAFLWSQWLMHDLANIFVYLPRKLDAPYFFFAAIVMLGLHAFIFSRRGGEIQQIVTSKTNTGDIRSATVVDFIYGFILVIFKEYSNMPMSTTWVFLGLLAGRETAISLLLKAPPLKETTGIIFRDAGKATIGLAVSAMLALGLPILASSINGTATASSEPKATVSAPSGEGLAGLASFEPVEVPAGTLRIAGSDTLRPVALGWIEEFSRFTPTVSMELESKGTVSAIPALIAGEAEIGLMSRAPTRDELAAFRKQFQTPPVVVQVGLDALAVYVHQDNPLRGLTLAEVASIFGPQKAGRELTWGKFVLPPFPDEPISVYGRNELSGTRDFFVDVVLDGGEFRRDYQPQEDSVAVVDEVGGSLAAIGYAGLDFSVDSVRPIAIAQNDDEPYRQFFNERHANDPSLQRRFKPVYSGQYPLARHLYAVAFKPEGKPMDEATATFLRYAISKQGQIVVINTGLIPLDQSMHEQQSLKLTEGYRPSF